MQPLLAAILFLTVTMILVVPFALFLLRKARVEEPWDTVALTILVLGLLVYAVHLMGAI